MKKILSLILFGTLTLATNCQEILTIGEVFDFSVGDEFHTTNLAYFPNGTKSTITKKWNSPSNDTVYYEVTEDHYYTEFNMDTDEFDYYYRSLSHVWEYTNLDSSIYTYHYLAKAPTDSAQYFEYDSLNFISSRLCNKLINGFLRIDGDFEPMRTQIEYGKGLGKTYHYDLDGSSGSGHPDWEYELVYYNKDGIKCGTPDWRLTGIVDDFENQSIFEVYPTLVRDWVKIEANRLEEYYDVRIVDISGRNLVTKLSLTKDNTITLTGFDPGIYIVIVTQSNQVRYFKRIIKK